MFSECPAGAAVTGLIGLARGTGISALVIGLARDTGLIMVAAKCDD